MTKRVVRHLFVCTNGRASGKPACGPRGGDALVAAVQHELLAGGAAECALVTPCGCLGPCFDGPNAVVYPDGIWYAELAPDDAGRLADHLMHGVPHAAKVAARPGSSDATGDETSDPPTGVSSAGRFDRSGDGSGS